MATSTRTLFIDAANLHVGGGVQVAASFLNDLPRAARERPVGARIVVRASCEVLENLHPTALDHLEILRQDSPRGGGSDFKALKPDTIFTIFGPCNRPRKARREVVGFALPRMIYEPTEVRLPRLTVRERLTNEARWLRLRWADILVVETNDCADRLRRRLPGRDVRVVPNAVSQAVLNPMLHQRPSRLPAPGNYVDLAVVGRSYAHKNLRFLGPLAECLERKLGTQVRYVCTLTDDELDKLPGTFKSRAHNVGPVRQRELACLYQSCKATIFPSLMEVFSVTPLESMSLGIPTFVSDLANLRSVYRDGAAYFNPWDAESASEQIATYLNDPVLLSELARLGQLQFEQLPTSQERTDEYWGIITEGLQT